MRYAAKYLEKGRPGENGDRPKRVQRAMFADLRKSFWVVFSSGRWDGVRDNGYHLDLWLTAFRFIIFQLRLAFHLLQTIQTMMVHFCTAVSTQSL